MTAVTTESSALFHGLVDDAGLFPPERLPMDDAVRRHRTDEAVGNPVLTQRFLCPVTALDQLRARLGPDERWRIGLIVDVGLDQLVATLRTVEADDRLQLETIELQLPDSSDAGSALDAVITATAIDGSGAAIHVELSPAKPGWQDILAHAAAAGLATKVRCGGLHADLFPSAQNLASFLVEAARRAITFKATAGLHHAIRYTDPTTGFTHHGFLNLLAAVCRAVDRADADEVADVLLIDDAAALAAHVRTVTPETAVRARALFRAYGSCNTYEPIDDLTALGFLEVART